MRTRTWLALLVLAVAWLALAGCAAEQKEPAPPAEEAAAPPPEPEPAPVVARATLQFTDSFPNASGTVTFTEIEGGVQVSAEIDYGGETRVGLHGIHLHADGDCSAEDFTSTGGHFNPTGVAHGAPDADEHHAGDFGNIEIGDDFKGTLELVSTMFGFEGETGVIGRGVILHAGEDDLTSQPTGAAGARDACGAVVLAGI